MRHLAWILVPFLSLPAVAKRNITETDLYAFRWAADPQISPDGSQVAFVHVTVTAKKDGYETSIWLVPARGGSSPRQVTAGPRDMSPRWSPDGKRLAFLRSAADRQPGQIYILPMGTGGEARQLTDLAKGAANPVWSPEGSSIAFTSTTAERDLKKREASEEEPSDVRVITRAEYRFNGIGYRDFDRPSHIWTVAVPEIIEAPAKPVQVTSGRFSETDVTWSRDGTQIYFASNRDLEPYYKPPSGEIYVTGAKGGEVKRVTSVHGTIRGIKLSPDGQRIAFVAALHGDPIRSYWQPELFIVKLQTGSVPRNLTEAYDFDAGGTHIASDQKPPRGAEEPSPFWSADSGSVYVVSAEEGRVNLRRIDMESGMVTAVTNGNHDIYSVSASTDGTRAVLAISTPTRIGDLFALNTTDGTLTQLTDVNRALFSELSLTEPEMIWYKSFDGRRIQTWVQRPPEYVSGKKYPLILNIHGGPHAAYGYAFDHEFQWMAAKGYVVLYPNPRGSTTYGQEFGNVIQHKYPGDDYKDLIAGVDELIKRGIIDPEKLGVTGGSGGGVLTNWAITQTNRFKAAVSQRSIADWAAWWYTGDFPLFQPTWFKGAPWEDQAGFRERSPLTYVEKITTPLMLIEGEADFRTPPAAGGEPLFRALKYLKRPVTMVQFPGETHELSRSGRPRHRVERLQHIVAWFDKYLMGQNTRTYDVQ